MAKIEISFLKILKQTPNNRSQWCGMIAFANILGFTA